VCGKWQCLNYRSRTLKTLSDIVVAVLRKTNIPGSATVRQRHEPSTAFQKQDEKQIPDVPPMHGSVRTKAAFLAPLNRHARRVALSCASSIFFLMRSFPRKKPRETKSVRKSGCGWDVKEPLRQQEGVGEHVL
jgi:hypothetical protein